MAAPASAPKAKRHGKCTVNATAARIVYLIVFLDLFAVSMLMPALRKELSQIGSSHTVIGLISSVYGFAQLFSSPVIGEWSDRFGRVQTMFSACLLASLGYLLLTLSFWTPFLFLGRFISGCFKHTQTLCRAYLIDLDGATHSSSGTSCGANGCFGNYMAFSTLGFVLGPIAGGHLAEHDDGFVYISIIVCLLFVINGLLARSFLPEVHNHGTTHDLQQKLEYSEHQPAVAFQMLMDNYDVFLLQFVASLSVDIFRFNFVHFVHERFHVSIKTAGYMTAYQALLGVLGSSLVNRKFFSDRYQTNSTLLLHSSFGTAACMIAMAAAPNLQSFMIISTILSLLLPFGRLADLRFLTERSANREHYGVLMGNGQSVGSLARMSSCFLTGLLLDYSPTGPEYASVALSVSACLHLVMRKQL